jgi:hypothetical protein
MGAELTERYNFACGRNGLQPRTLAAQVKARHAEAAAVVEDQSFERAAAISDDERRSLLGDRDDPADRL